MKCNFANFAIYFLILMMFNGCAVLKKPVTEFTNYTNQEFENKNNLQPVSDSVLAKPPIGFAGIHELKMIFEDAVNISDQFKFQKSQNIKSFPGVGFDSLEITEEPVTDPLMIAGVACIGVGILGSTFIPFSSVLVLVGIGLVIASLIRIKNHPDKYKGKGMGIATLVVVGALLLLSIVVILFFLSLFG